MTHLAKALRVSLTILFLAAPLGAQTVRIIQTNAAGDNAHIIDPATNEIVGEIPGLPLGAWRYLPRPTEARSTSATRSTTPSTSSPRPP